MAYDRFEIEKLKEYIERLKSGEFHLGRPAKGVKLTDSEIIRVDDAVFNQYRYDDGTYAYEGKDKNGRPFVEFARDGVFERTYDIKRDKPLMPGESRESVSFSAHSYFEKDKVDENPYIKVYTDGIVTCFDGEKTSSINLVHQKLPKNDTMDYFRSLFKDSKTGESIQPNGNGEFVTQTGDVMLPDGKGGYVVQAGGGKIVPRDGQTQVAIYKEPILAIEPKVVPEKEDEKKRNFKWLPWVVGGLVTGTIITGAILGAGKKEDKEQTETSAPETTQSTVSEDTTSKEDNGFVVPPIESTKADETEKAPEETTKEETSTIETSEQTPEFSVDDYKNQKVETVLRMKDEKTDAEITDVHYENCWVRAWFDGSYDLRDYDGNVLYESKDGAIQTIAFDKNTGNNTFLLDGETLVITQDGDATLYDIDGKEIKDEDRCVFGIKEQDILDYLKENPEETYSMDN